MTAMRVISTNSLILIAIGVATIALAIIFTFPAEPLVWQIATWTLVTALTSLLALVLVSGYFLATNKAARTWQRVTTFLVGLGILVAVAIGTL